VSNYYEPAVLVAKEAANSFMLFSAPPLSESEVSSIFSNITVISDFNQEFLEKLEKEQENWPGSPVRIGRVFKDMAPFLRVYTEFTNNFQHSIDTINECMKRHSFVTWLQVLLHV
jgi:hypothetical protein